MVVVEGKGEVERDKARYLSTVVAGGCAFTLRVPGEHRKPSVSSFLKRYTFVNRSYHPGSGLITALLQPNLLFPSPVHKMSARSFSASSSSFNTTLRASLSPNIIQVEPYNFHIHCVFTVHRHYDDIPTIVPA